MNITLRKANALQQNIQDTLKGIEIKTTVSLNEFENVEAALTTANEKLLMADNRRAKLSACLYDIRSLIGTANAASGINDRLAKAAYIDKRLGQLSDLTGKDVVISSLTVINGKLDKIKNDKSDSSRSRIYGYSDEVSTGVLSQEQANEFKAQHLELKKAKQRLNDEILELNVRTEITLPMEVEAVLSVEGLL
jgi:hypothetical protein